MKKPSLFEKISLGIIVIFFIFLTFYLSYLYFYEKLYLIGLNYETSILNLVAIPIFALCVLMLYVTIKLFYILVIK